MRLYQTDLYAVAKLLLPTFLRQTKIVALLTAMIVPFAYIQALLVAFRTDSLYRLNRNGQVCYLRATLNDAFPDANGDIKIEDGVITGVWQYAWEEDYDPYRNYLLIDGVNSVFWAKETIAEGLSNFIVKVPASLRSVNNEAKLRGLINYYKLVSKSYSIIYV